MKLQDFFVPTSRNKYRAYLLKAEFLVFLIIGIIIVNSYVPDVYMGEVKAEVDKSAVVVLHNRERLKNNLQTLVLNSKLIESANAKADLMLQYDCWDHYCPPGTSPWVLFEDAKYDYLYAGENLAEGFNEDSVMMRAWMNSPTHRENILKPEFTEIGVGYETGRFQNKNNNTIVVIHFGRPNKTQSQIVPISGNLPSTETSTYVQVEYPVNGSFISSNTPLIKGKAVYGIDTLLVYLNDSPVINQNDINGSFAIDPAVYNLKLPDGEQIIKVAGYANNQYKGATDNIRVNIDTVLPQIDYDSPQVEEIVPEYNDSVTFYVTANEDLVEARLILTSGRQIRGQISEFKVYFDVPREELINSSNLKIVVTDKAGNSAEYFVNKNSLEKQIDLLISETDIENTSARVNSAFRIAKLDWEFNINSLSTSSIINIIIAIVLVLLLIVDYVVISKNKQLDVHRHGHHHIKIGLLIGIIMFILMAAGVGSILNGWSY